MQVLGLVGKLLTGPWMTTFYTSHTNQVDHIKGITIVKQVIGVINEYAEDPLLY